MVVFNETVPAVLDHGKMAKIAKYMRHSFSLGTHKDSGLHTILYRVSPSTYSTNSRLQEVYTLLITCSIHHHICWRHYIFCTRLSLEMFYFEPAVGWIVDTSVMYNVGPSTGIKYCDTFCFAPK